MASNGRQFPALMRDRFCPLSFSLLLTAYKNGEGGLFQSRELQTTHSRPIFCEHREWESRPPKSPTAEIHLHGCAGDQIFGERLRDCSRDLFVQLLRSTSSRVDACCCSSSRRPFEGLHSVHLPAPTSYGYIEQTHEMSRVNGATGALSIGPSAGYTLFFVFVHVSLLFTAYASSYTHMHIHVITYIALFFWIKLKLKMPNFLTNTKVCCVQTHQYILKSNCFTKPKYFSKTPPNTSHPQQRTGNWCHRFPASYPSSSVIGNSMTHTAKENAYRA